MHYIKNIRSAEDAAREYNKHALKIQGMFAVLNKVS